jgi:AcrR family transcriptional regulator
MSNPSSKRPNGRSTRVKTTVFDAVETLLAEKEGEFPTMAEVAEHAGVNATSLYRRWGDVRKLLAEVAVERLMRDHPIPDQGSARDDVMVWATSVADAIGNPDGLSLLRVMASDVQSAKHDVDIAKLPISRRIAELDAMLERGKKRGERVPSVQDLLEIVLAPLYLHALFLGPIKKPAGVARLVDRAFGLARD